jgi:hypothetical protein
MRPSLARLTLARKIAAITLTIWKKGASFDPVLGRIIDVLTSARVRGQPCLQITDVDLQRIHDAVGRACIGTADIGKGRGALIVVLSFAGIVEID